MSCRSTAAGSLATTFVQRRYHLFDGQCTSLFHELKREAASNDDPVTTADYLTAVDSMEVVIRSSNDWSDALRTRAMERISRARQNIPSSNEERAAFIAIDARAGMTRFMLDSILIRIAEATEVPEERIKEEFKRLYNEAGSTADRQAMLPTYLPKDPGTKWAIYVLLQGNRCDQCGRFVAPSDQCMNTHVEATTLRARPRLPRIASTRTPAPRVQQPEPEPVPAVASYAPTAVNWASDMDTFQETYDKMRARFDIGEAFAPEYPELEVVTGGITGGLAAPGGISFGLEIEVDFPDEEPPFEMREILAERLYAEGIAITPRVSRWHFIGNESDNRPGGSYQVTPDGWSCERDSSVDPVNGERGIEIKSQILYDEPRTWHNLRRICEITRELGGRPTPRCGLHVNVGATGFPRNDPTPHTNLLKLAASYDDTLIRMSHNPQSGPVHRGRRYCNPVVVPPEGYGTVDVVRAWSNHYQAFNFNHVPSRTNPQSTSSRIEARLFDSSLDLGRIQAQVALTVGLVSAARNGVQPMQETEIAGSHRARYGNRKLTGEAWENSTVSFRQLTDILASQGMNRSEHREMFTWLFAATRWQKAE